MSLVLLLIVKKVMIIGYYEHEGDIGSNPSCSKDVVIPDSITTINYEALNVKFSQKVKFLQINTY